MNRKMNEKKTDKEITKNKHRPLSDAPMPLTVDDLKELKGGRFIRVSGTSNRQVRA